MTAYLVIHNRIVDADKMEQYLAQVGATLSPHQPQLLALDERSELLDGRCDLPRTVIIAFPSRQAALAWYQSSSYQQTLPLRLEGTEGFAMLVEGLLPSTATSS